MTVIPMQPASRSGDAAHGAQKASHFYETAKLQSLVSPVPAQEFYGQYWEKKPLIVHRNDPGYYGDLFTLKDFDDSTKGGRGYVKTAEATTKKQSKLQGTGTLTMERVMTEMRDGHTLILDGLHDFNPKLGLLCRLLGQETGARFQTNIYLTPPSGKGFQPHWDNHDVFVLQVMGSKHWKVEKNRRTLPEKDGSIEDEGREFRGDVDAFTLDQGDMVYIPRGFVHAAECGPESSLHITLGIYYNSWDELLQAAIKAVILRDDNLRLSLPVGHMQGDEAEIVKRLTDVLHEASDPEFLTQVLNQFRAEVVQRAPLDISGQITSFHRPRKLSLDDRVGPRPGIFHVIRKNAETATLNVGTRAIAFPEFFGPALEFVMNTPSCAIHELPGGLEDHLKLVFIERLMQEAVVVLE